MEITRAQWNKYINNLGKCSETAKELVKKYIETHDVDSEEGRDALIRYCYSLATKYGEAATELACRMYDFISEMEGAGVDPAEPAEVSDYDEVAKAVNGTLKSLLRAELVAGAISRIVKLAGQDTTLRNAIRDHAYYAWIPVGDTCPYCLQIAAEGWNLASRRILSGGHADHIHGNCNCAFSIKHNKDTDYDFYDPEEYAEVFEDAEGNTSGEKFNAVRRMMYQRDRDTILAQKRAVYAETVAAEEDLEGLDD